VAAFLLTLLAVQLAGIGGRDQMLLAHLSARTGERPVTWLVATLTGALAAALAGWAAQASAAEFDHRTGLLALAIALALAGGESLVIGAPRMAKEPTHSLGAAALVFLAHQVTDASRLVTFALALVMPPLPVVAGATVAGGATLFIGLVGGERLLAARVRLRLVRVLCGAVLLGVALAAASLALGDIDRFTRLFRP
jgi:putative Ca2+/H+ antiporter (TMEM165/GDT1 family)